jgi:hypothetical protein
MPRVEAISVQYRSPTRLPARTRVDHSGHGRAAMRLKAWRRARRRAHPPRAREQAFETRAQIYFCRRCIAPQKVCAPHREVPEADAR